MRRIVTALLAASAISSQSLAQDTPSDPNVVRLQQETAVLNAQAARDNAAAAVETARAAKVKAQTDSLGLSSPEGKATIGTNGGVMEAWMLSASTADAAGAWITADVLAATRQTAPAADSGNPNAARPPSDGTNPNMPPPPPRSDNPNTSPTPTQQTQGAEGQQAQAGPAAIPPILLLGGDDALVLDTAEDLRTRVDAASTALQASLPQFCSDQRPATSGSQQGGAFPFAAVGAIAGLLKTDTEISGVEVPVANRMLVASTGRRLVASNVAVRLPSAVVAPDRNSPLASAWGRLLADRDAAKACRPRFAAKGKTVWIKKTLAAMDQQFAAIDALEAAQTKPDDKGVIPLARAVHVETLLRGNPWVLRISVEKGGGSILKRSNVWTALGAPAIGISGGLVVSFTLTVPTTGDLLASGALVCRTALTNMGDVQAGRVRGGRGRADCAPMLETNGPPVRSGATSQ